MSRLKLTKDEVKVLPLELRKELSSEALTLGDTILEIICDAGECINLDVLLVVYWQNTGTVVTRYKMQSEVYKLVNKKLVSLDNLRKSVYFITKKGKEEVALLKKEEQHD